MPTHDMHLHHSKVTEHFLNQFCSKYSISPHCNPTPPSPDHNVTDCPNGYIAVYTKQFEFSNLRIPFSMFFLDFLKHYHLHISQLSPLGLIKVTHFELASRALGTSPSLPLFRRFFKLARYGDWYTVEKRVSPGCVCSVPKYLKEWKNMFFWVSEDVVPFTLRWRQRGDPLNVVDPLSENVDGYMFKMLMEHPTRPRPLPEHVLIMAGLSRNWPYAKAEPIIKDGDQEIGLLKYIERNGLGGVKLTCRLLAENEDNILERTKGICYEASPSRVQSDIQGDVNINTGRGDVEIPSEHMTDPKRMPVVGPGKYDVASCSERRKFAENAVAVSTSSENSRSDDADASSHDTADKQGKKIVFSESSDETDQKHDVHVLDRVGCLTQLVGSVPDLVTSYEKKAKREARLRDRISRYRLKMTLQAKKVRKLKKRMVEQGMVAEALKKEMEDARVASEDKLKRAHEGLELEKDGRRQERMQLESSLQRVSSERQWLIQEGFEYVINRLHKSGEYLGPLGAVQTNLWDSGVHYGVEKGYESCKAGVKLEDVSLYQSEAHQKFLKAVHELEHARFPYVVALSQCADRTLDELKALEPIGMEEGDQ